jgi:hypothetical protein
LPVGFPSKVLKSVLGRDVNLVLAPVITGLDHHDKVYQVYILLPVGFLTAKLTESLPLNIGFFYISGIPLFLFGVYFWGMIGKAGAKISFQYISYFNAFLLISFGAYLIYNGFMMI